VEGRDVINAKLAPDPSAELRRREARVEIQAAVPLRELGHPAVDARLVNLSSHGFMAETDALIEPGSRVWLTLPGLTRANARVVWCRSGRIGGEFAEPIDPLEVFQAVGRATA
jgi:hypothetical protein